MPGLLASLFILGIDPYRCHHGEHLQDMVLLCLLMILIPFTDTMHCLYTRLGYCCGIGETNAEN